MVYKFEFGGVETVQIGIAYRDLRRDLGRMNVLVPSNDLKGSCRELVVYGIS
jgi:hypothetical protein